MKLKDNLMNYYFYKFLYSFLIYIKNTLIIL